MPIRRKLKSPEEYARELEQYRDVTKTVYDIYHASDLERQALIQEYRRKDAIKKEAQMSPLQRLPQTGIVETPLDIVSINMVKDFMSSPQYNVDLLEEFTPSELSDFKNTIENLLKLNPGILDANAANAADQTLKDNLEDTINSFSAPRTKGSADVEAEEKIQTEEPPSVASAEERNEVSYADRVDEIEEQYSGDPGEIYRGLRKLFVEKYPNVKYATSEYIDLVRLKDLITREDVDIKKLRQRLRENKAIKDEERLNVKNLKLQIPEAPVTPQKTTATKGKSKSEPKIKKAIAVREGEGLGKAKSAKAKPKRKPKMRKPSCRAMPRKSDMIYNILSQRAGNDNLLMAKRIAKAQ